MCTARFDERLRAVTHLEVLLQLLDDALQLSNLSAPLSLSFLVQLRQLASSAQLLVELLVLDTGLVLCCLQVLLSNLQGTPSSVQSLLAAFLPTSSAICLPCLSCTAESACGQCLYPCDSPGPLALVSSFMAYRSC